MTLLTLALVTFLVSLLAAALGAAVGMAGGVFLVPVFTLLLGFDWDVAVATSLLSVVASSSAAAPPALDAGLVNLRLSLVLEIATVTGSLIGVLLLVWDLLPRALLFALFALILVASAIQVLRPRRDHASGRRPGDRWARPLRLDAVVTEPSGPRPYVVHRVLPGMGLMLGAGTLSTLLGIGSGVLKIPAMDATLGLPVKISSGTANLMIGVTTCGTAAAVLLHHSAGHLGVAGAVVIGSVLGSIGGARLLVHLPGQVLRVGLGILLAALSVPMLVVAVGGGR
ncbi:MAG: sulfite exporter TauE/SafE family protein [Propionibacteriales bacterium]|nr:sulfite exporter TauE/SafE family protein [Propionibacteriales bacterium]